MSSSLFFDTVLVALLCVFTFCCREDKCILVWSSSSLFVYMDYWLSTKNNWKEPSGGAFCKSTSHIPANIPHPTSRTSHIPNIPHPEDTTSRTYHIPNIPYPEHPTSPIPHIPNIHTSPTSHMLNMPLYSMTYFQHPTFLQTNHIACMNWNRIQYLSWYLEAWKLYKWRSFKWKITHDKTLFFK